ncbi:MAG: glycerophosphodiester phosphodiesterase [Desulfobacterales bacterium]|nr:glycerophosphodiester phosphodiesterase [Desulfobacterales bacterium]
MNVKDSESVDVPNTVIVAHRGASKQAPENTIPAFKLAWEQGADAIEGDFHLTKDGAIVCIHDKDTKRVAGVKKVVEDTTLEELRKLDVGAWFGKKWKGTLIPTISEVFATIPDGKKIYMEIKSGSEILPRLFEELAKSGLKKNQVIVISFDKDVIRNFKNKDPGIKAFWLSDFKKDKFSDKTEPSLNGVIDVLRQTGADGFSSTYKLIDDSFIKAIQSEGFEYHVWTVDDPETAQRFKRLGAKSIITNLPGYMKKNLEGKERGKR